MVMNHFIPDNGIKRYLGLLALLFLTRHLSTAGPVADSTPDNPSQGLEERNVNLRSHSGSDVQKSILNVERKLDNIFRPDGSLSVVEAKGWKGKGGGGGGPPHNYSNTEWWTGVILAIVFVAMFCVAAVILCCRKYVFKIRDNWDNKYFLSDHRQVNR